MQISQRRDTLELTEEESWRLLDSVSLGRVVFTMAGIPAIRPVNHLIDGKTIVIRSHLGAAVVSHAEDRGRAAIACMAGLP
jgi:hypothetical protein